LFLGNCDLIALKIPVILGYNTWHNQSQFCDKDRNSK